MQNKKFKIVTKSKHFIYFVTEENENKNWCLKIAVKNRFKAKFKKAVFDTVSGYKVIAKIKLAIINCPNYMRLNTYEDSPYKIKDLEPEYKKEIRKTIINSNTIYCNESIPYYDYAVVLWEEINDKEKFYLYETPNQQLAWVTTPLNKNRTGLAMNVELALQSMGKIINEPPYIIVQNDYEDKRNLNWVKMRLNGTVLDNKKLIFDTSQLEELKSWIEINKLPILMYWTQEENSSSDIIELIKTIKKQDKIKQILGNIENTEIFLEESNFIQKPSYDEILDCLKNSKEIVYKKININNFKEEIEKLSDIKAVFCVVKGNDYSALSEITEPLSGIHSILEEKNVVFFGWDIYEKTENYKALENVYSLIVK